MKTLSSVTHVILVVYILVGVYLYLFQRSFIYFPTKITSHSYQVEWIDINNHRLNIIKINPDSKEAIIYFGGNAENVSYSAAEIHRAFPDYATYLINYRGYGGSTGEPSEEAFFSDALTVFDQIQQRHKNISVAGRSIGSGVATYLASKRPVYKLILVTPYDSILAIAEKSYPVYPVAYMLKDHYDSISQVAEITAPTLAILAEADRVVPRDNSMRLIDAFPGEQIRYEVMHGTGHNTVSAHKSYYLLMQQFLSE